MKRRANQSCLHTTFGQLLQVRTSPDAASRNQLNIWIGRRQLAAIVLCSRAAVAPDTSNIQEQQSPNPQSDRLLGNGPPTRLPPMTQVADWVSQFQIERENKPARAVLADQPSQNFRPLDRLEASNDGLHTNCGDWSGLLRSPQSGIHP